MSVEQSWGCLAPIVRVVVATTLMLIVCSIWGPTLLEPPNSWSVVCYADDDGGVDFEGPVLEVHHDSESWWITSAETCEQFSLNANCLMRRL
jgi:hypothetical protein